MDGASIVEIRRLAMDYLARREHASSELVDKLMMRGVQLCVAQRVVHCLTQEGLQDDRRFADLYVKAHIRRGKGPRYIQSALQQHGLERGAATAAIDRSEVDWLQKAYEVALKKYGTTPCQPVELPKRARFMMQRGFTPEQATAALQRLASNAA